MLLFFSLNDEKNTPWKASLYQVAERRAQADNSQKKNLGMFYVLANALKFYDNTHYGIPTYFFVHTPVIP